MSFSSIIDYRLNGNLRPTDIIDSAGNKGTNNQVLIANGDSTFHWGAYTGSAGTPSTYFFPIAQNNDLVADTDETIFNSAAEFTGVNLVTVVVGLRTFDPILFTSVQMFLFGVNPDNSTTYLATSGTSGNGLAENATIAFITLTQLVDFNTYPAIRVVLVAQVLNGVNYALNNDNEEYNLGVTIVQLTDA